MHKIDISLHCITGDMNPWQALANAVVIQAVHDYRNISKMLKWLRQQRRSGKRMSEDEMAYLDNRIAHYCIWLLDIRSFFRSDEFLLYSGVDGSMLLRRLESESF